MIETARRPRPELAAAIPAFSIGVIGALWTFLGLYRGDQAAAPERWLPILPLDLIEPAATSLVTALSGFSFTKSEILKVGGFALLLGAVLHPVGWVVGYWLRTH